MSSPIRRRSIFSMSATTSFKFKHARLQHLLAAEGQQLAGQRGGAVARLRDLLDSARSGSFRGQCSSSEHAL